MRKGKLKKALALALTGAVIIGAFAGCGAKKDSSSDTKKEETKKIVIGASPSPHADILKVAKKELKKEGYELEIKEYSDYVQPNTALESGDLDANYFQHKPYLDDFNKKKKTHLVSAGTIHYEPFGIFPGKTKSLKNLKNGATVAVPNDTTNEARALLLLQDQGLIKLKDGAGLTATKKDIVENKKDLAIKEIEAAQIPRSLKDVDIAVVNGNYALQAGLKVNKDALATEDADSIGAKTYGNIVAVKKGNEKSAATKALIKALKSDAVKKYINDKYDGAVVPLF
jgi:D-methionine transport system substrate-binding protein